MCFQVAVLSGCDESSIEQVYQYGRNIGIAFQLVDDLLDFISTEQLMGKPTAADLKLGLATAPVLFAAHQVMVKIKKSPLYSQDLYCSLKCLNAL